MHSVDRWCVDLGCVSLEKVFVAKCFVALGAGEIAFPQVVHVFMCRQGLFLERET